MTCSRLIGFHIFGYLLEELFIPTAADVRRYVFTLYAPIFTSCSGVMIKLKETHSRLKMTFTYIYSIFNMLLVQYLYTVLLLTYKRMHDSEQEAAVQSHALLIGGLTMYCIHVHERHTHAHASVTWNAYSSSAEVQSELHCKQSG